MFDTLIVCLKEFLEKSLIMISQKSKETQQNYEKLPIIHRVKIGLNEYVAKLKMA